MIYYKNYQGETISTGYTHEELIDQLKELKSQGKMYIILPSAFYFKVHGFEGVKSFTHDEWLESKRKEWEDEKTWDEDVADLSFEEWLEVDTDTLYYDIEGAIDDLYEDLNDDLK